MAIDIENTAENPKRITIGDRTTDEHGIRDLIEADRYVEAKKVAKRGAHFLIVQTVGGNSPV